MIEREIGPWHYSCDPEGTRAGYLKVDTRGADECGCLACQNFLAAWPQAHPDLMLNFLKAMGIDPHKEAEVIHYGEYGEDPTFYGWWFHALGKVEEELEEGYTLKSNGYELTDSVSIQLSNRRDLAHPAFGDSPLIQVELFSHLPWALKRGRRRH